MSVDAALGILRANAAQLDPEVVAALADVLVTPGAASLPA